MTDEQVKKGLECCVEWRYKAGGCEQCAYKKDCDNGTQNQLYEDALALINRLETECADKERYTIELYNRAREAEREKEQIRKETAKEILQDIEYGIANTPYYRFNPMITREIESIVSHIQKKWNVEVEQ